MIKCSGEDVLVNFLQVTCVCKTPCVGWRVLTRLLSFNIHLTVPSVFGNPWYGKTFLRRKHRRLSETQWPLRPSKSALYTRRTHLVRCRSLQQHLTSKSWEFENRDWYSTVPYRSRCPTGYCNNTKFWKSPTLNSIKFWKSCWLLKFFLFDGLRNSLTSWMHRVFALKVSRLQKFEEKKFTSLKKSFLLPRFPSSIRTRTSTNCGSKLGPRTRQKTPRILFAWAARQPTE